VSTRQQRIAELAKQSPQMGFTSLAYFMDIDWLREAYQRTRRDGAAGVDGQTAADYAVDLEANLQSLLNRAKSGTYHAPPVRRVHIPKGAGGDTRPIGIPTFEDKILQRAVAMLLVPIYEQDFHPGSFGFRPQRSAHQALETLRQQMMDMGGCALVEVDIRQFFDTLDHAHLRTLLKRRVRDGVLLRLIGKWLNAGVLETGRLTFPAAGTPQGGVISPLLANVYLHYVLDEWFERELKPSLRGRAFLIRYADDFVLGFTCDEDAQRVMEALPQRFGAYGLTLHPDKTRRVAFRRPPRSPNGGPGAPSGSRTPGPRPVASGRTAPRELPDGSFAPREIPARSFDPRETSISSFAPRSLAPRTFDLLGFTHYWAVSRRGCWVIKRRTAASRLRRGLKAISAWCRAHRHLPLRQQQHTLGQKLRGHFAYFGITGNSDALRRFREAVTRIWRKWLSRRTRGIPLTWEHFTRLLERYALPPALVVHSVYRQAAKP